MRFYPRTRWLRVGIFAMLLLSTALMLSFTGAVRSIDNAFYDMLLPHLKSMPAKDIVIVAIDEASLAELGRWPWSRSIHARLIDRLTDIEVRAIGFNLIFAEPDVNTLADHALLNAVKKNGRVVLATAYEATETKGVLRLIEQLPGLMQASAAVGHTDIATANGVVRGVYLAAGIDTAHLPAFALALQQVTNPFAAVELSGKRNPNKSADVQGRWVRDFNVLIPFVGPANSFSRHSYADVLSGRVDLSLFHNKTVLVGVTAVGLGDQFNTPMANHGSLMPGVELQANLLQAIRSSRVIKPLSATLNILICLTWLLFAVVIYPRLSAHQAVIFAITHNFYANCLLRTHAADFYDLVCTCCDHCLCDSKLLAMGCVST